ncbi:MAG: hypothetical protein WC806_03600 [Candidatus Gracilibacteria bacterium]
MAGAGDDLAAEHDLAHRLANRSSPAPTVEVAGMGKIEEPFPKIVPNALHPILLRRFHCAFGANPLRAEAAHLAGAYDFLNVVDVVAVPLTSFRAVVLRRLAVAALGMTSWRAIPIRGVELPGERRICVDRGGEHRG